MELVTGRAGSPHITAQQDRQLHQGIWGEEAYILNTGNMLEPEVQSSNKILIKDGALMFQGALFSVKVGTTDEITINNGNQGLLRKDTIAIRYHYDSAQNVESAEWHVIQGTAVSSNPVTPTGISGNIQDGDTYVDCPVYVVSLNGINITAVDRVPEIAPDIPTLNASLAELSNMNRYVFLNMQARSVPGSGENYLNVASVVQDEGDPSIVSVTTGSAAIRVRQPGRYLMIVRLSVATADPNIEVNAYRWNGSEYEHYRGIASVQVHGMMPLMTVVSVTETDGRIAVMITNNKTSAVSIGAGTAIILIPLF